MHKWMHGDQMLLGYMNDRLCIIAKVNCVHSEEASNSFKAIMVSSNEVLLELGGGRGDCLCCTASFQRCNRSLVTFSHLVVGFLGRSGVQCLCANCMVHFICMTPSFKDAGRPSLAGPDVSAMYHWVWTCLGRPWELGLHSMAVSWAPSWGMAPSIVGCQLGDCVIQASGLAIGI